MPELSAGAIYKDKVLKFVKSLKDSYKGNTVIGLYLFLKLNL